MHDCLDKTLLNYCHKYFLFVSYLGRYSAEPAHYEVVVPHKITEDGDFISYMIPHHYKRSYYRNKRNADLTSDDKVHYIVPIAGQDHHLELSPSIGLISPSMVIENIQKGGNLRPKLEMSDDVQCHYSGGIRGDNTSKAAISTCEGLVKFFLLSTVYHTNYDSFSFKTGYIRSNNDYYFIEPAADHYPLSGKEHPHLIYRRQNEIPDHQQNCYVISDVAKVIAKRAAETKSGKRNVYTSQQQLYIETLVVLDTSMIQYHNAIDLESYVMTVFNMVSSSSRYFNASAIDKLPIKLTFCALPTWKLSFSFLTINRTYFDSIF